MKTFLFFIAFFVLGALKAQGNLQFNQVINMPYTGSNTTPVTVPAGKVWKIESCMLNTASNTYSYMLYNGVYYNMRQQLSSAHNVNFPFWLASGTSVTFGGNGGGAGGLLSIIEFNIVP
ncbi:MAG: hypothetical protein EB023_10305 [Flavobacteriia bacterium]|nr:hypothetical protein [Flavobacteriia bacterium]